MAADEFPRKLALVLKALSLSRGRLAAELGVGKSLVSRWVSGANAPAAHNLAALTDLIASRRPGFTLFDWEGDLRTLAARLGLPPAFSTNGSGVSVELADYLPRQVLREGLAMTALRGDAYEGFWRSTRPVNGFPGRFLHDRLLIRRRDDGLLSVRLGVVGARFEGMMIPIQSQIFGLAADAASGIFIFAIFNAVLRHRAAVLDGLTLTMNSAAGGTPMAAAAIIERTGLLSDDPAADEAAHEASIPTDPLAPEGSIPEAIRDHLYRDVGPAAAALGGEAMLTMAFAKSLSRGVEPGGPFSG